MSFAFGTCFATASTQNGIAAIVNNTHIWFEASLAPIPPTPPVNTVPEPISMLLLGSSVAGLLMLRRPRHG